MKIILENKSYPKEFEKLKDKPKHIYVDGDTKLLNYNKIVAIVGSRKMTSYGERVLEMFVPELVRAGYVIVSGFMYGVDTYAHRLTVENNGKTIAVLGSGIKSIYPSENAKLYTKIIETGGLVISEYKTDQKPKPWMFAKRNRLIAALAVSGVFVIEAGLKSGSLITVNRAIELNRQVYAVPGQITSSVSKGTNELIASRKAEILTSISAFTKSPLVSNKSEQSERLDNRTQKRIYKLLQNEDMTIDQISVKLDINAQEISSEIMQMDFNGLITEDRGIFRLRQT